MNILLYDEQYNNVVVVVKYEATATFGALLENSAMLRGKASSSSLFGKQAAE